MTLPNTITPEEAGLLRDAGLPEADIQHSATVAATVLWLAESLTVDTDIIRRGAIFHDLGKAKDSGALHGIVGAAMGRDLGIEEAACRAMLVHVRAGVPPEEAEGYGLPPGDYRPACLEEKLIIVADKLTDMVEDGYAPDIAAAWEQFPRILRANPILGKDEATTRRYLALAEELKRARKELD